MKIEPWKYEDVNEDGTFPDEPGAVNTAQGITMSEENGGCGLEHCKCSEGHWICITFGRDTKTRAVEGVTVYFDNWGEMQLLLSTRKI